MKDQDEQLLGELARRNWIILAILALLSLLWRSTPATLGVLSGGMLVIAGYHWLHRSLAKVLADPVPGAARRYIFSYIIRLGVLAAGLLILITRAKVDPIGLAVGLSVVPINIIWATLKRTILRGGSSKP